MTVLYSKQGCPPCNTLKRLFDSKGYKYIVKDISEEKHRQELYSNYNVATVPVVDFGDEFVVGLNLPVIMKKLTQAV